MLNVSIILLAVIYHDKNYVSWLEMFPMTVKMKQNVDKCALKKRNAARQNN